ncbi:MAG: FtsX-like permease family protein [Longimicrobiales bacterium]
MYSANTLAQHEARRRADVLRATSSAAGAGLLALFLSAIGLYAVVAFAVGQRTREIGIRTALGARPSQVIGLFFFRGLNMSVLGLLIGLPLGLFALRLISLEMRLPQANPSGLIVLVGSVVVAVASLATWLPARRAAGIDPLVAWRTD